MNDSTITRRSQSSLVPQGLIGLALPLACLMLTQLDSQAAIRVWKAPVSGGWGDNTKWVGDVSPQAGDTIYITNSGTFTVTIAGDIPGGTLYLGGISGGTQSLDWTSGSLSLTAVIGTNGVVNLLGNSSSWPLYGVLTNYGTIVWPVGSYAAWSFLGGVLENRPGALVDVQVDGQFAQSGGGVINNAGTLRKSAGAGTLSFASGFGFNHTGLVDVQSGTLQIADGYSQIGGQFNFGIRGPAQFGQINFPGAVALTGTISANLIGGFNPSLGDSFAVVSYGSHTGTFTGTALPPLLGYNEWQVVYGPTITALQVGKGEPWLTISVSGNTLTFSWSVLADPNATLQSTTNLAPPIVWSLVTSQGTTNGDQRVVTIPMTGDKGFFRLVQ